MKPATRVYEFTTDIIEFCESDPRLYKELIKERERFFTLTPEKHYTGMQECQGDGSFDTIGRANSWRKYNG